VLPVPKSRITDPDCAAPTAAAGDTKTANTTIAIKPEIGDRHYKCERHATPPFAATTSRVTQDMLGRLATISPGTFRGKNRQMH
jgi:hypothetical protein